MRALGTEVRIAAADSAGALAAAAEIRRLEAILSRFRDSPLTRLNRDGRLEQPPVELVAALRHALEAADRSGGRVTPTVLPALEHAGYVRSWPNTVPPCSGEPTPVPPLAGIEVGDDAIRLPPGVRLDLGGTAKSWIVERAARLVHGDWILDAGGDVLLERGAVSPVEVAHPLGGEPLQILLPPGRWGVATSSLVGRAWPGAHHLIDPRSARPARSRWLQATAVSRSLCWAEVATKCVLLGGADSERRHRPDDPVVDDSIAIAFDLGGSAWVRLHREWRRHATNDPLPLA